MGFEHDRIHLETSSVLFRESPQHLVQVPSGWPVPAKSQRTRSTRPISGAQYPENEMLHVAGRDVTLGKPKDFPAYGWDNEYGSRTIFVGDFQASKYMISNGEFHEFVVKGGYRTEKYWCTKGR